MDTHFQELESAVIELLAVFTALDDEILALCS